MSDIVPDESNRKRLTNQEYECVVVYDENRVTDTCRMAYKTVSAATSRSRVVLLKGKIFFGIPIERSKVRDF